MVRVARSSCGKIIGRPPRLRPTSMHSLWSTVATFSPMVLNHRIPAPGVPRFPEYSTPTPRRGHIWEKSSAMKRGRKRRDAEAQGKRGRPPFPDCGREVSDNDEISSSGPPSALRFLPLRNPQSLNFRGSFLRASHPGAATGTHLGETW